MTDDRVALFERDIAGGPEALARLLDGWRTPELGRRSRLAFAGLGSSRYAALVAASQLRARGTAAWVEYPSASVGSAPSDDLVFVAISASGRTREVLDAAEWHRGRSLVVAVTNAPDAPLARTADLVVPLEAGEEAAGIACRTFRATVAALALLTGTDTPPDLRPTVDRLAGRLASRDSWLPPLVAALDGAASIDVLAESPLLGLAEQAALMLREAPRLPATAGETTDWLHTGVYLALPGHRAMLYGGSAADTEVVATVARRGGAVAHVAPDPGGPVGRTVVESVAAELAAAALWARVKAVTRDLEQM